jgi:hypothetical protein
LICDLEMGIVSGRYAFNSFHGTSG